MPRPLKEQSQRPRSGSYSSSSAFLAKRSLRDRRTNSSSSAQLSSILPAVEFSGQSRIKSAHVSHSTTLSSSSSHFSCHRLQSWSCLLINDGLMKVALRKVLTGFNHGSPGGPITDCRNAFSSHGKLVKASLEPNEKAASTPLCHDRTSSVLEHPPTHHLINGMAFTAFTFIQWQQGIMNKFKKLHKPRASILWHFVLTCLFCEYGMVSPENSKFSKKTHTKIRKFHQPESVTNWGV